MQMSQQLEIGLQSTPSQNVVNIYQFQKIGGGESLVSSGDDIDEPHYCAFGRTYDQT